MKTRADEVIQKVKDADHIEADKKAAVVEKLNEWKSDKNAESNSLAVTFEKFWMELEPIFSEMGWI